MKKVINYKVSKEDWGKEQDKAFEKLNKNAKIDGFRPGKAPRSVFEKKYGKGEIATEAANSLIQKKYESIINDDKVTPIVEPKIDIVKLDEEEFEVNFTIITRPDVKLGEYKNLKVKQEKAKVTKDEIEHRLHHLLEDFAEIVEKDGKVEDGDIAIIDFEGFKDGVAFDGGKAENYQLEIGSKTFIPGFEEGLIGMAKDEEKDLELTFPEDYAAEELKGQKVVFKVKLHSIKKRVIPEMDKDFFEDLGMEGIDTKEKLEKEVEKEIKEQKEKDLENDFVEKLLEKASANMEVEIDDEIVEHETNNMYKNFMNRMAMQGVNEEIYLKYANTTKEEVMDKMKEEALKRV